MSIRVWVLERPASSRKEGGFWAGGDTIADCACAVCHGLNAAGAGGRTSFAGAVAACAACATGAEPLLCGDWLDALCVSYFCCMGGCCIVIAVGVADLLACPFIWF